jgi:hypothetical protein
MSKIPNARGYDNVRVHVTIVDLNCYSAMCFSMSMMQVCKLLKLRSHVFKNAHKIVE